MTAEEAERLVRRVFVGIDGGCLCCTATLFWRFNKEFLGFEEMLDRVWMEEFDYDPGGWRLE